MLLWIESFSRNLLESPETNQGDKPTTSISITFFLLLHILCTIERYFRDGRIRFMPNRVVHDRRNNFNHELCPNYQSSETQHFSWRNLNSAVCGKISCRKKWKLKKEKTEKTPQWLTQLTLFNRCVFILNPKQMFWSEHWYLYTVISYPFWWLVVVRGKIQPQTLRAINTSMMMV